jgi:hypothetical protein
MAASTEHPRDTEAKAAIDRLTAAFFDLFSTKAGERVDLAALHTLCVPQAVIVKTVGPVPEIYDLAQFIAPRERLLNDGTLVDFSEQEVSERTEIFGNVAHRFCLYRKSGILSGQPFATQGMKSLQFIHTPAGWRLSAVAWDDERAGLTVPTGTAA